METTDKILLYGVAGLVAYAIYKNSAVGVLSSAVANDVKKATQPFQNPSGFEDALQRNGFKFSRSGGYTWIYCGNTTYNISDKDINRTEYIKRRMTIPFLGRSCSFVFG